MQLGRRARGAWGAWRATIPTGTEGPWGPLRALLSQRTRHAWGPRVTQRASGTRGTRFSTGAPGALHTRQPLIPFLTGLPGGTNEANQSNVALFPLEASISLQAREARGSLEGRVS